MPRVPLEFLAQSLLAHQGYLCAWSTRPREIGERIRTTDAVGALVEVLGVTDFATFKRQTELAKELSGGNWRVNTNHRPSEFCYLVRPVEE